MRSLRTHLEGKRHILWDWNGTLLDDVDVCVEVISDILSRHALPPVDRERYLRVFRFPVRTYYQDLGFDFAHVSFEHLTKHFIAQYNDKVFTCGLFGGCKELLSELAAEGVRCSVLSAAQEDHLRAQLRHHGIDHHFDYVFGIRDFYAASKIDRGLELLERLVGDGVAKSEIILVGDTDHDVEVARALGIDVLLVEGGHQHRDRLQEVHHLVVTRVQGVGG